MTPLIKTIDLSNTHTAYYAPATITPSNGGIVHISGQPGNTKDGHVPADYESQIHLALLNLRKIIIAAGASIKSIAKLMILVVNYDPFRRQHTRHIQKFLAGHRPAITLIPVTQLAVPTWLFEIEAVLTLPEKISLPPTINDKRSEESVDVVIIGAGLAGLSAAQDVIKAGFSCVVLEARDRVGGKTWSQTLSDGKGNVDLGAAWINDTNQSKVFALAKRFGAELIEQNTTGDCVIQDASDSISTFPYGELPPFDSLTVQDVARIRDMCEQDCQALDVLNPDNTKLDSMTFEAYLKSRGASEISLLTASVWTRAMLGQDPKDLSALYFLNYCKSGGGLLQMRSDRKGGGQHLRVRQGMQLFATGLSALLPEGTIRLSSPVTAINQNDGSGAVKVHSNGKVLTARKVITTVPTPILRNISFTPSLPYEKQVWVESTTYGYYTKAMMVFRTPFWIKKGFCGLTQSFIGPASVIRDTSSPADGKAVLTCFMAGEYGTAWSKLSDSDRANKLCEQIGRLFGVQDTISQEFVELVTYEWSKDEFSGWGCPCTGLPPGVLDTLGGASLRKPWKDLHFAGTETAGEWKGYMEGAVRSGERAAAEVVKGIKTRSAARL